LPARLFLRAVDGRELEGGERFLTTREENKGKKNIIISQGSNKGDNFTGKDRGKKKKLHLV